MEKLVYIRWIDSIGCTSEWSPIDDMLDDIRMECESVGWIGKETKHYILLVPHWHKEKQVGENGKTTRDGCGEMAIPKVAVLERKELSKRRGTNNKLTKKDVST